SAATERGSVRFDEFVIVHDLETLISRQHRLLRRRPQIGEDQSVALRERIPRLAHLGAEEAALRLAGLLEATPLGIEKPAAVAAANAPFLHLAVIERGAAMTTTRMHKTRPTLPVAKQHQVFTERAYLARRAFGVRN